MWGSKHLKFYADFKMGLFIVVSSSYQKLGPTKELYFLGTLAAEGST
jgi:hypothetical protein